METTTDVLHRRLLFIRNLLFPALRAIAWLRELRLLQFGAAGHQPKMTDERAGAGRLPLGSRPGL
jgi:hypothetical protein